MTTPTLNLYQKLVQIRRCVEYIQKNADGFNFKYATETQILGAIRGRMDDLNVFLEMDVVCLDPIKCTVMAGPKDNKKPLEIDGIKGIYEFKWTNADNPSEYIIKRMIVQDSESDITTVGGLMTYAHRYFLYKFFSVPTDKDDPDTFENRQKKLAKTDSSEVEHVTPEQVTFIESILQLEGRDFREQLLAYFSKTEKINPVLSDFVRLPKHCYDPIVKWTNKRKAEREKLKVNSVPEEEVPF